MKIEAVLEAGIGFLKTRIYRSFKAIRARMNWATTDKMRFGSKLLTAAEPNKKARQMAGFSICR